MFTSGYPLFPPDPANAAALRRAAISAAGAWDLDSIDAECNDRSGLALNADRHHG